jgi:gamma-glutamyltranspeptidase/glutathione hydrolase
MAPTLVTRKGKVVLALGASGGPTIISGTLQVLINVVDFKMEPRAAVSHARIHHQWRPNALMAEADVSLDVTDALRARGHTVLIWPRPVTAVQLVAFSDGLRYAVSDPRKLGRAAGY